MLLTWRLNLFHWWEGFTCTRENINNLVSWNKFHIWETNHWISSMYLTATWQQSTHIKFNFFLLFSFRRRYYDGCPFSFTHKCICIRGIFPNSAGKHPEVAIDLSVRWFTDLKKNRGTKDSQHIFFTSTAQGPLNYNLIIWYCKLIAMTN